MKVELNFSEHAGDEAMAIAVWRAMTSMGRGRAQSLFRQCVISGLRNMRESDLPEEVAALIAQGVKPAKRDKKAQRDALVTGDDILLPGLIEEDRKIARERRAAKKAQSQIAPAPPQNTSLPVQQIKPEPVSTPAVDEVMPETPAPQSVPESVKPVTPPQPEPEPALSAEPEVQAEAPSVVKASGKRKSTMFTGLMG